MATAVPGRRFRHRKGGVYTVMYIAKHTETSEEMVVYRSSDTGDVWVRPRTMWEDEGRFNEIPTLDPG